MALIEKSRRVARPPGIRTQPECVVLGVREGVAPSPKPPVRIFLGTEPAQYRAERVFFWSVEQVRDPSRIYEIYLMKDLVGFDRTRWLTGFTNYRLAIPDFAGGFGRAIYNDVDQVYLGDPGELFDADLGEHGFLALTDHDTAVMLIDCAQMASVWTLAEAQRRRRSFMEAKARAIPGLYGRLDPVWHARDGEYVPNRSKLLHYTAIHLQPWQPTPHRYAYQHNPAGQVWLDLERAADAAAYEIFTAAHPSEQYKILCTQIRQAYESTNARDELPAKPRSTPEQQTISWRDLVSLSETGRSKRPITDIVSAEVLDALPAEDVPWVLDELFRCARRKVTVSVTTATRTSVSDNTIHVSQPPRPESWWMEQLEAASRHHPERHWQLIVHTRNRWGREVTQSCEGGRRFNGNPTVWVLTDDHPGNTTQTLGLAKALGWPYEVKELHFTWAIHLHDFLFGRFGATRLGLKRTQSAVLTRPWPDLVITTGWRTAHIARWIKKQSRDHSRLVQMGRKGTHVAQLYDLAISCRYFRLPPHLRRIETLVPLTEVSSEKLSQSANHWQEELLAKTPRPRIALLVGGTSYECRFDEETAYRLGVEVRSFAETIGATVFATTSRRTGAKATEALNKGLGDCSYLHEWQPDQSENPYLAYLALAEILIVTGESESMLADAAATGKPVYIYPLPKQELDLWTQVKERIVARSEKHRWGNRGTIQPQKGVQYVCARLVERGIILPQADLRILHETLVESGIAQFFGSSLGPTSNGGLREVDDVARRVRTLMGMAPEAGMAGQMESMIRGI